MKSVNNYKKVATDMSLVQLIWSAWFISIVLIVFILLRAIGGEAEINQRSVSEQSFLTFAYHPSKIFMLIMGIISVSGFLTFFVKQGVTRMDYFYGAAISSVIVSLALMIIAGIVTSVEQIFNPEIVTGSFMGSEASWIFSVGVYSLNILIYFMAGWLIGSGFYRFGAGGILYILIAVSMVFISDILWQFDPKNSLGNLIEPISQWEFPIFVSFIGTTFLLGITLWIVRGTTKRVRIKLK